MYGATTYVGSADGVFAFINTYSGTYISKETFTSAQVLSTPAVANGVAYVGSSTGNVFGFYLAVVAEEGWKAVTGAAVTGAPTVANGQVFVPSSDGSLYTYDLSGSGQMTAPPARPEPMMLQPDYRLEPVKTASR